MARLTCMRGSEQWPFRQQQLGGETGESLQCAKPPGPADTLGKIPQSREQGLVVQCPV